MLPVLYIEMNVEVVVEVGHHWQKFLLFFAYNIYYKVTSMMWNILDIYM
jgi:hypothetical protein